MGSTILGGTEAAGIMDGLGGTEGKGTALGVARLSRMAFSGPDLNPVWQRLLRQYVFEPDNADALMDLSIVEQFFGNRAVGVEHQARALEIQQLYRSPCAVAEPSLRVLALA